MEAYLTMQSRTAQAQLAEAQRLQWSTQLTQMARPPIGMNGLSNAMSMDQQTHSGSLHSALDMFGLGQGRNSISSPMSFEAFSPTMAPSPYTMSDTHEIVQLPPQVEESTASRFTEVNESPNGKTGSQLPGPSSPARASARGTTSSKSSSADSAGTIQRPVEPATTTQRVNPVNPNTSLTTSAPLPASSQTSTANRGISNGPPQSVRLGAPSTQTQSVPAAAHSRPAPVKAPAASAVLGRADPMPNRVSPVPPNRPVRNNNATVDPVHPPKAVAPAQAVGAGVEVPKEVASRVRQRSESDEEAAGERHTKRRRTDQVSTTQ
jgi:hypothetical protein